MVNNGTHRNFKCNPGEGKKPMPMKNIEKIPLDRGPNGELSKKNVISPLAYLKGTDVDISGMSFVGIKGKYGDKNIDLINNGKLNVDKGIITFDANKNTCKFIITSGKLLPKSKEKTNIIDIKTPLEFSTSREYNAILSDNNYFFIKELIIDLGSRVLSFENNEINVSKKTNLLRTFFKKTVSKIIK